MRMKQTLAVVRRELFEGLLSFRPAAISFLMLLVISGCFELTLKLSDFNFFLLIQIIVSILQFFILVTIFALSLDTVVNERRENRLEVLLSTPLDKSSFILGKFLSVSVIWGLITLFSLPLFLTAGSAYGYYSFFEMLMLAGAFFLVGSALAAFGIFFSTLGKSSKNVTLLAIFGFVGLTLISGVAGFLKSVDLPFLPFIFEMIERFNPFQNFSQIVEKIFFFSPGILENVLYLLAFTLLFLTVSILALEVQEIK